MATLPSPRTPISRAEAAYRQPTVAGPTPGSRISALSTGHGVAFLWQLTLVVYRSRVHYRSTAVAYSSSSIKSQHQSQHS
eukprot:2373595-Rhodomonas_salina.2